MALALSSSVPSVEAEAAGPVPVIERSFVVVLDPGHGGSNSGCAAYDGVVREKDVTLALAQELEVALQRRLPHATVVLTRSGDETVALAERVERANAARADLLLSLHANASSTGPQSGFETYILDARLADRDASHTARAGAAEAGDATRAHAAVMLRELALLGHRARAAGFAKRVQQEQAERFPERLDRGVKQGSFDVLLGAHMPAVLFEAGFLDHPHEGQRLLDAGGRALVVDGLAEAVIDYYREHARQR